MTIRPAILDRSVMMSSLMPSEKYSCSASPDMLVNGKMAIDAVGTFGNGFSDAFVDDRGNANAAGLGQRLETGGDVDAVAVNVVAFDDDVAEIDADPQHDFRLADRKSV